MFFFFPRPRFHFKLFPSRSSVLSHLKPALSDWSSAIIFPGTVLRTTPNAVAVAGVPSTPTLLSTVVHARNKEEETRCVVVVVV